MVRSLRLNDNALGFPSICSCTKASVVVGCTAPKLILILSAWRHSVLPFVTRSIGRAPLSPLVVDSTSPQLVDRNRHLIQFNTIHCQCGHRPTAAPWPSYGGIKVGVEDGGGGRLLVLSIKNSVSKWNEFGAIRNSNNPFPSYQGCYARHGYILFVVAQNTLGTRFCNLGPIIIGWQGNRDPYYLFIGLALDGRSYLQHHQFRQYHSVRLERERERGHCGPIFMLN